MKKHAKKIVIAMLVVAMLIPTVAMVFTSAAESYTVELAFNNIFVFEEWANNSLSSTVFVDGVPSTDGKKASLETNLQEGSFTLTKKDMVAGEIYTAFSMDSENPLENANYYTMPVKPNTTYTFFYNIDGNIHIFTPYVFMFTNEGLYEGSNNAMAYYSTPGYGNNYFEFTTPANVTGIQVRFTIGDNKTVGNTAQSSVYATVKDIAICESALCKSHFESKNLFSFDGWAGNALSSSPIDSNTGTITTNADNKTITFTTAAVASTILWSGNNVLNPSTSSTSYYSMNVSPNTSYTLLYSISSDNTLPGPVHCQPYIIELDANGNQTALFNHETQGLTGNKKTFTTTATTARVQLVFAVINDGQAVSRYCTLENIGLYKTENLSYTFSDVTGHTHRQSYDYSGDESTYGVLPTPSYVPDGYIFADWFTGENGTGTRITADTKISYSSHTVYPKFEPAVDSLAVETMPAKTTYTVGEKFNPAGLVLKATIGEATLNITSGYKCSPEYLTSTGTQTITARYGGKTVTFNVNVTDGDNKNITVNGAAHPVKVANNKYTLDYSTTPFNRYELTYFSDSHIKGTITMDGVTEVFFLEPSDNGRFASYIDSFLKNAKHYSVAAIEFECLDKEFGNFELLSVSTIDAPVPDNPTQYYKNDEYKVGIALNYGGVVSEVYDLENMTADDPVVVRVYNENGKDITRVDHRSILNRDFGTNYIAESTNVNLINTNDRGRYLQQSYYGTSEKPFEMGDYNGVAWPYNPVQGGNINHFDPATGEVIKGGEASKVIDYRITDKEIYIKTRPLDWGKNSEDYPDSYVTDSYMEAWYVFEDGMIKTYCRFVDFSGYPSHIREQELPAFYTIEPLNNYVYYAGGEAWSTSNTRKNVEEPDFWGVLPEYNELLRAKGKEEEVVDPDVECNENWAAFTASPDANSFGIGVYSAGVTDFHYGMFPAVYNEDQVKQGNLVENYRHAASLDPSIEASTSYIAPVGIMTFESFKPIEYSYYVTTGTEAKIREDFRFAVSKDEAAAVAETKIAVPETVYMTPADGASKVGQYYVNNILDLTNYYNIETVAERDDKMYFGIHVDKATKININITNVTNSSDDIQLVDSSGANREGDFHPDDNGTIIYDEKYNLRFASTGLQPGKTATAKWTITATLEDGTTATYTAYTVLYAPERTVGAVAESRRRSVDNNETGNWITGATSMVTDSSGNHQLTPIGSWEKGDPIKSGYFKQDPLIYPEKMTTESTDKTADDHINVTSNATAYVMQTAVQSDDHSRAKSYLGLLTIDQSRYTNTNQIPNLKIGYDVLHVHDGRNDSLKRYDTLYTLGTAESYNPTGSGDENIQAFPSGWSSDGTLGRIHDWHDTPYATPYRQTVIPSYTVSSSMNGQYLHAFSQALANYLGDRTYGTAVTSVMIKVTDKSELRDLVTESYTNGENSEALENAATVLGDPTATQEEIDAAKKDLSDAVTEYFVLRYDNIFSAYEMSKYPESMKVVSNQGTATYSDGTITVVNGAITGGEAYTVYGSANHFYKVQLKPNTEYVFEYDVTTDVKAQAFMFFYDKNGNTGDVPTNMSVKVNNGTWASKSEGNAWWGNYTHSAGTYHYAIKFTTGPNTTQASFRFGNTSNDPVTSTFSKIKLIESDKYYEGVTYSKTEAVYLSGQSYGTLQTLTRPGYTFGGWVDAKGNTVTNIDIATEDKTIYSVWTEHTYTIVYNSNSGSGSIPNQTVKYSETADLASSGFTKSGYALAGWSTDKNATTPQYTLGQKVSKLTTTNNGTVTLYAVWIVDNVNVTFDNLIDLKSWDTKSAGNATISNVTATGFTLTSNEGAGEGTKESVAFPVTAGKQYKIDIDITGNNWDVYIFFQSNTVGGTGIDFTDSGNRYASGGAGNQSRIFTAPAGATKAVIRLDANGSNNAVTFNNIRVYEYSRGEINVKPSNKYVSYNETFGELPTPTREGFTFVGWYDGTTLITSSSTVSKKDTYFLQSKWIVNDSALVKDTVVIDFSTPIEIKPLDNDKIYNSINDTKTFLGFSADGTNYATTINGTYGTFRVNGQTVTYTPSKAVDGIEKIYYHASVTDADGTTTIKNEITVAPASNVLYEDTFFSANDANSTGKDWTDSKLSSGGLSTSTTVNQDSSPIADEKYGYDSNKDGYNKFSKYSNGTAKTVTVDSTNMMSKITAFNFKGTGFDLNSACGANTGVMVVSLKNNTTGKMVKSYVVDTYYGDAGYGDAVSSNTLYQVPIISESGLDTYADYTVQISAAYLPSMSGAIKADKAKQEEEQQKLQQASVNGLEATVVSGTDNEVLRNALAELGLDYIFDAEEVEVVWFDENSVLNGGMGADTPIAGDTLETAALTELVNVIDSVRVYNPLNGSNDYYIESEKNATYYNVIENLSKTNGGVSLLDRLFAYITGKLGVDENGKDIELSISNYESVGPKDELYLAESTSAVAFKISNFATIKSLGGRVMISLRAASGTPKFKIGGKDFPVNSNTEMYYDITDYIGADGNVTFQNTKDGDTDKSLLAIGYLKITSPASAIAASISSDVDLETVKMMMMAPSVTVEPNTTPTPEEPEIPDTPEDPAEPEDPATPEEPAEECWLVRIFKWIIDTCVKFFNVLKGFLAI